MLYETNDLKRRITPSPVQVRDHINFLREKFYKIDSKWKQFEVLFNSLELLSTTLPSDKKVLILERAYFYGGWTLFSPIFFKQKTISIDCFIDNQEENFGKQESWLDSDKVIKWRSDFINPAWNLKNIESNSIDVVIVPNVIHHIKEQTKMFDEFNRVLKRSGKCIIFEGLVREIHHLPDDYLRYTPEGVKNMFEKSGLNFHKLEIGSGIFDVISYVWQNALEFFPEELKKEKEKWFYENHYPELQALDKKYNMNLTNPEKSFPMSYVIWGQKR